MDLVLTMSNGALISVQKFACAGYITIFDRNNVNIFDSKRVCKRGRDHPRMARAGNEILSNFTVRESGEHLHGHSIVR